MNEDFKKNMRDLANSVMSEGDAGQAKALYEANVAIVKASGIDVSPYPTWAQLDAEKREFWVCVYKNGMGV